MQTSIPCYQAGQLLTVNLRLSVGEKIAFWYLSVREGQETLHFRHGFRTKEETIAIGDDWIRRELGAMPKDEATE